MSRDSWYDFEEDILQEEVRGKKQSSTEVQSESPASIDDGYAIQDLIERNDCARRTITHEAVLGNRFFFGGGRHRYSRRFRRSETAYAHEIGSKLWRAVVRRRRRKAKRILLSDRGRDPQSTASTTYTHEEEKFIPPNILEEIQRLFMPA